MKVENEKPEKTGEIQERDERGRFIEGVSGNPDGRPEGSKNHLTLLEEALIEEAKKENKTFWQKLAEWCFVNPKVATAVLKKFVPDKTSTEITGIEPLKFEVEILNGNKKPQGE